MKKSLQLGSTFIEILLYIGIISFLLISYFYLFYSIFSFFNKKEVQREVSTEANFLLSKIGYFIENAKSILEPQDSGNYILIETYSSSTNPTKIFLNSNNIYVKFAQNPEEALNSNRIFVESLNFNILKNATTASSVYVFLKVKFNNLSGREEFDFSFKTNSTFTLKNK